jgi:DNA (cytosine-5)-methyltransferase 1
MKGSKKIKRTDKNGYEYYYSEGGMDFPDSLEKPGRTILTSEASVNRSTHVIEDLKTKQLRLLTPKECERMNGFNDDWTTFDYNNEVISDRKRYFLMGNALVVGLVEKMGHKIDKINSNYK